MDDWQNILLGGLSGIIDSQRGTSYSATQPQYNTANGVAGQSQATTPAQQLASNPLLIVGGIAVVGLIVYLLVRK